MIPFEPESQFAKSFGYLWHEIKGGAWHTTSPEAFVRILADGKINPGPIPERLIAQGLPPCFSSKIGAVSVFDFVEARWHKMKDFQRYQWPQFFCGDRSAPDPQSFVKICYAIEIDRTKAPGWRTIEETLALWKEELNLRPPPGNVIPWHETCHHGSIPLSTCVRAIEIRSIDGRVISHSPASLVGARG